MLAKLTSRFRGSLAALSAVAGIVAGILGGWLTGHWLWAPACGLLVLVGLVAGIEALKARGEDARQGEESPGATLNLSRDTYTLGGNASLGDTIIAGRDVNQNRTTNNNTRTWNMTFKGGVLAVLAVLTLGGAFGWSAYLARQPDTIVMEGPDTLVAQGNHDSPEGVVKGVFGDILVGDLPGVCSYVLPNQQDACSNSVALQGLQDPAVMKSTSLGIGHAIISGNLALVPVIGKVCSSNTCHTYRHTGLPSGASFQAVFRQSMNPARLRPDYNFIPCEKVDDSWYATVPGI
jgi:hypothetical protein